MPLLAFFLLASIAHATSSLLQPQRRELDPDATTDPSQFYRRAWHGSVLLGENIYVDGGECTYSTSDGPVIYPYNSTYSLDLSSSWSPDSVRFNKIDKGNSPVYNTPNIWPASSNKTFYSINGDITLAGQHRSDPPAVTELWEFTPEGNTTGEWRLAGYATSLIGTTRAKSTYGGGSAYILGGFSFDRTSSRTNYIDTTNGIVSYDMQTGQWQNRSMDAFAPPGWWSDGHIHFVDNLGGNGTVVAFGGVTPKGLMSLTTIELFNPDTGEWRNQSATGDIPQGRRLACSIGVAGDNGTYEIFIHGGSTGSNSDGIQSAPQATINLDQVWVLSIPSFTWYKSTYKSAIPRWAHTCHVPGNPSRRQMVAIGGRTPDIDSAYESKDPWPQGLGVFDLTQMEWVNSYNASADLYVTPRAVKDGISKYGLYPQTWDDPDTPTWLTGKSAAELLSTNSSTDAGTSNDGNGNNTVNGENAGKGNNTGNNTESSNNTGSHDSSPGEKSLSPGILVAIIIGAIVASIAIVYLLGRLFRWPLPGLRSKHQEHQPIAERWDKPELDNVPMIKSKGHEMNGVPIVRYEMVGTGPVELPSEFQYWNDKTVNSTEANNGSRIS